jgi:hypothetical protein
VPDLEHPDLEQEILTDLSIIAGKVNVEIQRDGSVLVTGIPDTVPEDLGQAVAEIALDAAMRQVRRTPPVRPNPSRDDRRRSLRLHATPSVQKRNVGSERQPDKDWGGQPSGWPPQGHFVVPAPTSSGTPQPTSRLGSRTWVRPTPGRFPA